MSIPNALKPVFRARNGRPAKLPESRGLSLRRKLSAIRRRIVPVYLYMALSLIILTLVVVNTGAVRTAPTKKDVLAALSAGKVPVSAQTGLTSKLYASFGSKPQMLNRQEISIDEPFVVNVRAGSALHRIWANSMNTVNEVIKKAGVSVDGDDTISTPKESPVARNMNIVVHNIQYKTLTYKQTFAGKVKHTTTPLLAKGKTMVKDKGRKGVRTVTSHIKFIDGVKSQETVLKSEVTKKPRSATVATGTALRTPISKLTFSSHTLDKHGLPQKYNRVVTGLATAYSAHSGAGTASGMRAGVGRVAVNTNMFPYGTRLYIVGADGSFVYGYAVAADTGGFARKHRVLVDLYFDSYAESCAFGARRVKIYVLG